MEVMGCIVKSLSDVKVTISKLSGKKSNHVKGWCGPGQGWYGPSRVQSPGDFDGLVALGWWFIKLHVKPDVIPNEFRPLENKQTK